MIKIIITIHKPRFFTDQKAHEFINAIKTKSIPHLQPGIVTYDALFNKKIRINICKGKKLGLILLDYHISEHEVETFLKNNFALNYLAKIPNLNALVFLLKANYEELRTTLKEGGSS